MESGVPSTRYYGTVALRDGNEVGAGAGAEGEGSSEADVKSPLYFNNTWIYSTKRHYQQSYNVALNSIALPSHLDFL